jgi:two-component system cell cycle response regulator
VARKDNKTFPMHPSRTAEPTGEVSRDELHTLPSPDSVAESTFAECDHLVLIDPPGPLVGRPFPLAQDECVVGREPTCAVHLDADDLSRRHARLVRDANGWTVEDLQSTNGTFVDGAQVQTARLQHGDRVQMGKQLFRLLPAGSPDLRRLHTSFQSSRIDQVTGLPLRELFEDQARHFLRERGAPAALLLVQFEYLDAVNRRHGRSYGDRLFRHAVRVLLGGINLPVCAGRLHGTRVAFLVAGADEPVATTLAEGMRSLLSALLAAADEASPVELSIGGAVVHDEADGSVQDLIRLAESLTQNMSSLGGGVSISAATAIVGETTGVFHIQDVDGDAVVRGRAAFERDLSRRFRWVVAFALDDRQRLEARDPGLVLRLDRILESALEEAHNEGIDSQPVEDTLDLDDAAIEGRTIQHTQVFTRSVQVGRLPAGFFVVATAYADDRRTRQLMAGVERTFERLREQATLPLARVTAGSPVEVVSGCVDRAVDALLARQKAADDDRRLPLPVGWALLQVAAEDDPVRRFFALIGLHQAMTRWIFTVLAADCLASDVVLPPPVRSSMMRPVGEGTWVRLARLVAEAALTIPPDARGAPTLLDAIFPRGKKSAVLNALEAFPPDRNEVAHGGGYRRAVGLASEWDTRFRDLLAGPLRALQHITPRHVSQLRHRGRSFEISYRELVGDHTVVPTARETTAEPMEDGKVFVLDPGARRPLSLDPLVVYAPCERCDLSELFFLENFEDGIQHASLREGRHKLPSLAAAGKDARDITEAESALARLFGA